LQRCDSEVRDPGRPRDVPHHEEARGIPFVQGQRCVVVGGVFIVSMCYLCVNDDVFLFVFTYWAICSRRFRLH
jgi:hypothetical protein